MGAGIFPFVLPETVVDGLPKGARVVEVGVGARWETLQALLDRRPDVAAVATDVHGGRLVGAPDSVRTMEEDIFEPTPWLYEGADLVYAVRCPEEMQPPLARAVAGTGGRLGLQVLKDELADLSGIIGEPELLTAEDGTTWRLWEA